MYGIDTAGILNMKGVVGATVVLLIFVVCAVLMAKSKRPDGKMAFLSRLIDATQQNDDDASDAKTAAHPRDPGGRGSMNH